MGRGGVCGEGRVLAARETGRGTPGCRSCGQCPLDALHSLANPQAPPGDPPVAAGVVFRVRDESLTVALDEPPGDGALDGSLRADRLANEVTHKRLVATLGALGRAAGGVGRAAPLVDVLFGARPPIFDALGGIEDCGEAGGDGLGHGRAAAGEPAAPTHAIRFFNPALDASQRAAVSLALAARDVALIHGPPGTGKTTAVVEVVRQLAARGDRVLVAAASNVAVDTLVERLHAADPSLGVVRVGHAARLLPSVLACSLEARVAAADDSALAADCRREMKAASARLLKLGRKDYAERKALRGELKVLARERREREGRAVRDVLAGARVLCATLAGVPSRQLEGLEFDVAVVDEAAQALEVRRWSMGRRAGWMRERRPMAPTPTHSHTQHPPSPPSSLVRLHRGRPCCGPAGRCWLATTNSCRPQSSATPRRAPAWTPPCLSGPTPCWGRERRPC